MLLYRVEYNWSVVVWMAVVVCIANAGGLERRNTVQYGELISLFSLPPLPGCAIHTLIEKNISDAMICLLMANQWVL